ncbi:MAG TPA: hypothetical protein VK745_14570, partial [Polyangiaceae bacterium]|nr:hypothetical protein [Polyangiaceae bacterium]
RDDFEREGQHAPWQSRPRGASGCGTKGRAATGTSTYAPRTRGCVFSTRTKRAAGRTAQGEPE